MNFDWMVLLRIGPFLQAAVASVDDLKKPGGEKKAKVMQLAKTFLELTEAGVNKDLVNNAEFLELLGRLVDDYAAILKFVKSFKKSTEPDVK